MPMPCLAGSPAAECLKLTNLKPINRVKNCMFPVTHALFLFRISQNTWIYNLTGTLFK